MFLIYLIQIFGGHDEIKNLGEDEKNHPDLFTASLRFPPLESIPPHVSFLTKSLWFDKHTRKTKRFVFDSNALVALKHKARSKTVKRPTTVEALSAFIWKSVVAASKLATGVLRPSLLLQPVNLRNKTNPRLADNIIGNLFWLNYNLAEKEMALPELVRIQRETMLDVKRGRFNALQGSRGFEAVMEDVNRLGEFILKTGAEAYVFTSWLDFGFNDIDFGWGKPKWVGVLGQVGPASLDLIIFKELEQNNAAVEAWITLEEEKMMILENDPEFLKFATPNPSIVLE